MVNDHRHCQNYGILLLVPIILQPIVLTGLERIVGGFRIALGLLGLQSGLSIPLPCFFSDVFHWVMGLDCVFNCGCSCCTDNICPCVTLSIPFQSFAFLLKSVTVRSYGVLLLSVTYVRIIGFVDYHTIRIVGLYNDWTGLYSLLVPTIPPPILLPGLHILYEDCRIVLRL